MRTLSRIALPLAAWLFSQTSSSGLGPGLAPALARDPIRTNEVSCDHPPAWLTEARVDKVVARVQDVLEWDIRRIRLAWYTSRTEFEKTHGFGPTVLAFARKTDNSVHMGPEVTRDNFETTFGHELTHVILYQKYKDSVPRWLEEGLANFVGRKGRVDYAWLASQPPRDVTSLTHPFAGLQSGSEQSKFHYQASTALAEMIASKCDLQGLLQLSVGSKFATYLDTTCGISDVNAEYRKWIRRKSGKAPGAAN